MKSLALPIVIFSLLLASISPLEAKIRGKFKESEWDRKFDDQRNAAFGAWLPSAKIGEILVKAELNGQELLMLEYDKSGRFRALLRDPVGRRNADNDYALYLSEEALLVQHAQHSKQGYRLIHLKENDRHDSYSAVWIMKSGYKDAVDTLAKIGVTPPTIEITGGVDAPEDKAENFPKIDLTDDSRVWTSSGGNSMQAQLLKVDGGTVTFKKSPEGSVFTYQIAQLSEKDQDYIRELVKMRTQEGTETTSTPQITDWIDADDFDTLYADEKAKGNFGAYVEYDRRGEARALFLKRPKGMGWYYQTKSSRKTFLDYNKTYTDQGLILLTCTYEKRNESYTSVWVRTKQHAELLKALAAAGINPAKITAGGTVTFSEIRK